MIKESIDLLFTNKHSFNWYSHFRYFVSPDLSLKTNSIEPMIHRKFWIQGYRCTEFKAQSFMKDNSKLITHVLEADS